MDTAAWDRPNVCTIVAESLSIDLSPCLRERSLYCASVRILRAFALFCLAQLGYNKRVERMATVLLDLAESTTIESEMPTPSTRPSPESGILTRIAAGDKSAVEECLDHYGGLVWTIAKRLSRTSADAEDAVQEIFVEIWQKAHTYDHLKSSELTFVAMLARRRMIDRLRRLKSTPNMEHITDEALENPRYEDAQAAETADEAAKALGCMKKLSKEQQKVMRLAIHHGMSHSGIATRLSMPLGTVKSYARRALLQLRECMNRPIGPQTIGSAQ